VKAYERASDNVTGDALARLLEHRSEFLKFIEKRVDSRATAEDILQTAFVRGIEKQGTLRDDENAVAWFYRLLRNAVIDHYRSKGSHSRVFEHWPENLDVPGEPVEFVKNEICRCVAEVLERCAWWMLKNGRSKISLKKAGSRQTTQRCECTVPAKHYASK
jgi:RNA polymerase sigma-70 factor (ECF subfamily)